MSGRLERELREYVTEKRLRHCLGVRDTAVELALRWNASSEKAGLAGLLHDVARELSREEILRLVREDCGGDGASVPCGPVALKNPAVLHAWAGMIIARDRFGVRDEEVLRSISLHTTGAPGMGTLERVLFVADYIEPGRSFKGVVKARDLAWRDLEDAVRYILKSTLKALLRKGRPICDLTVQAYNEIMLRRA
ncbi:MAG: bis(5'-nucleosyl)-tetraphosphatase (symmetrical) YqeK [Spirochaetota bacterium]